MTWPVVLGRRRRVRPRLERSPSSDRVPAFGRALSAGALAGIVLASLGIVVGAAAGPKFPTMATSRAVPDWYVGPFAGLGPALGLKGFGPLVLVMCACYLIVLALADAVRARWALITIVAVHLLFMLGPLLLSLDAMSYLAYGRLELLYGLDPYTHPPGALPPGDPLASLVSHRQGPSNYGPGFTLLTYPLSGLSVGAGFWVLKVVTVAASLAVVALVASAAGRLGRPPVPAALLVGLNPVLLVFGIGGVHNDFLMMLLAVGGIWLALAGRERLGAGVLVGAAVVKPVAGLVLPFMVLGPPRRRRALAGVLIAVAVAGAVVIPAFGADLLDHVGGLRKVEETYAQAGSVPALIGRALGWGGVTPGLRTIASGALLATVGILLLRVARGSDWISGAGWAMLALLLTTAWLWPWYIVWLLPLAGLAGDARLRMATLAFTAFLVVTRLPLTLA